MIIENLKKIRISGPEDIRPSAISFRDIVADLCGLRIAASHNIARKNTPVDSNGELLATSVFEWTEEGEDWWNAEGLALQSPITKACRYETDPFWINEHGIFARIDNPFLQEIDLSKFEQRAKTHAAIVTPVHMAFGQVGAVSFNAPEEASTDLADKFEEFGDELSIYARAFIRTYVKVSARIPLLPVKSKLTKREVECLRWAALGKTDHEIGKIIGRSQATVRFHIRNATEKLESVNKSQAVFKATQLGYISGKKTTVLRTSNA